MKSIWARLGWGKYLVYLYALIILSWLFDVNLFILILIIALVYGSVELFVFLYFKGGKFLAIKDGIDSHIQNCNDLNRHIEELKNSYFDFQNQIYGIAGMIDTSKYSFQRRELKKMHKSNQVYNCSLSICRNAANEPFKYLCKYFKIDINEDTLNKFGELLNNFSSAEEGKKILLKERKEILDSIENEIPRLIITYYKQRLIENLGFLQIDLSTSYFPTFTFQYVSSGGNSSMKSNIIFDIKNLNDFIQFINNKIDYINSSKGQRSLMTSILRTYIKERDKFMCRSCGNGIINEPNLLLEIDHIIPISRGGLTTLGNLQTLCWRCNRSKGSKIIV